MLVKGHAGLFLANPSVRPRIILDWFWSPGDGPVLESALAVPDAEPLHGDERVFFLFAVPVSQKGNSVGIRESNAGKCTQRQSRSHPTLL